MNEQDEFYALEMVQQQLEHRSMGKGYLFSMLRDKVANNLTVDDLGKEIFDNKQMWTELANELRLLDNFLSGGVRDILVTYVCSIIDIIGKIQKEAVDEKLET